MQGQALLRGGPALAACLIRKWQNNANFYKKEAVFDG